MCYGGGCTVTVQYCMYSESVTELLSAVTVQYCMYSDSVTEQLSAVTVQYCMYSDRTAECCYSSVLYVQ